METSLDQEARTLDMREAFADYLNRRIPAANPPEMQRLSIALYRLLMRGAPVAREELADTCHLPRNRIEPFLREFLPSAIAFGNNDTIVAFSGLSLLPTRHQFILDDAALYTWCAFDALFLPALLRKSAILITHCPSSEAELLIDLAPGEVRAAHPPGCVLSIVTPDSEACCDNLRKAFCDHVNLFKDRQAFREWSKGRRDMGCVTLPEAQLFARQRNALRYPDLDLSA